MKQYIIILFCVYALLASCGQRVFIMSWNVQNLFDDHHDGLEYRDFKPDRWNKRLYRKKLEALSRVIREANAEIVALQEVENRTALLELNGTYLAGMGYTSVLVAAPGSSVNTAFLSRFPVLRVQNHLLQTDIPQRSILEIEVSIQGSPLVLFNNHWKSRSGGARQTEPYRRLAAETLLARTRQLDSAGVEYLILGDLNEELPAPEKPPYSMALKIGPSAEKSLGLVFRKEAAAPGTFYSPWPELPEKNRGTYYYKGRFQTIDHILIPHTLLDGRGLEYKVGSFQVFRREFMVTPKQGIPRGFAKRYGYKGYSDHLPVVVEVERVGEKGRRVEGLKSEGAGW